MVSATVISVTSARFETLLRGDFQLVKEWQQPQTRFYGNTRHSFIDNDATVAVDTIEKR